MNPKMKITRSMIKIESNRVRMCPQTRSGMYINMWVYKEQAVFTHAHTLLSPPLLLQGYLPHPLDASYQPLMVCRHIRAHVRAHTAGRCFHTVSIYSLCTFPPMLILPRGLRGISPKIAVLIMMMSAVNAIKRCSNSHEKIKIASRHVQIFTIFENRRMFHKSGSGETQTVFSFSIWVIPYISH